MSLAPRGRREAATAPLPDRDSLYEALLGRILCGDYAPGERLPSEEVLAAEFGVSRPVLRQALARLREEDFISSRRGSGSYVRRPEEADPAPFAPISCVADIERCFEFRLTIESRAAGLAARHRGKAQLQALKDAHAHLEAVLKTGALGNEADFRFHDAVADATGNRFFLETLHVLRPHIDTCMRMLPRLAQRRSPARIASVRAEHRAILDAILLGDADAAERAMATHIARAQRRIFEGDSGDGRR
ncbi:FadR/GntR family transcriptional regulator [Roseomonas sp. AR75]|uniref:FadR/GntR family transcriptional regulator n=1 Tax=Roseomonas sp. AR75 TaxID=2562311 RepID=UPI0019815E9C|nr:FadR/GntR family transcriptional regulator [Roseomonas sp. AR75]